MKVVLYLRCFLFGAKSSTSVSLSGLVGAALGWLLSSSALTSSVEIPIWADWGVVVVGGGCWWACWLTCCRLTWFTWLELLVLLAGLVCGTACSPPPPPPPPPRIEWSAIHKVYIICGIKIIIHENYSRMNNKCDTVYSGRVINIWIIIGYPNR